MPATPASIFTATNHDSTPWPFNGPVTDSASQYASYFEDAAGNQWIFSRNHSTGHAWLTGNAIGWQQLPVIQGRQPRSLAVQADLSPETTLWLQACWQSTTWAQPSTEDNPITVPWYVLTFNLAAALWDVSTSALRKRVAEPAPTLVATRLKGGWLTTIAAMTAAYGAPSGAAPLLIEIMQILDLGGAIDRPLLAKTLQQHQATPVASPRSSELLSELRLTIESGAQLDPERLQRILGREQTKNQKNHGPMED